VQSVKSLLSMKVIPASAELTYPMQIRLEWCRLLPIT